jgi:hypothetical protein
MMLLQLSERWGTLTADTTHTLKLPHGKLCNGRMYCRCNVPWRALPAGACMPPQQQGRNYSLISI